MIAPSRNLMPAKGLDLDDLTQAIDAPLENYWQQLDEPTLTKLEFEYLEIVL